MNDISLGFRIAVNTDKKSIIATIRKYFEGLNIVSESSQRFEINKNYAITFNNHKEKTRFLASTC